VSSSLVILLYACGRRQRRQTNTHTHAQKTSNQMSWLGSLRPAIVAAGHAGQAAATVQTAPGVFRALPSTRQAPVWQLLHLSGICSLDLYLGLHPLAHQAGGVLRQWRVAWVKNGCAERPASQPQPQATGSGRVRRVAGRQAGRQASRQAGKEGRSTAMHRDSSARYPCHMRPRPLGSALTARGCRRQPLRCALQTRPEWGCRR
jgi:hypothetical protein